MNPKNIDSYKRTPRVIVVAFSQDVPPCKWKMYTVMTYLSEIWLKVQSCSLKMHLEIYCEISSLCSGRNALTAYLGKQSAFGVIGTL